MGYANVRVIVSGGPSQTFHLDRPHPMLDLLEFTLNGYDKSMWKLNLDGQQMRHDDLIAYFPPLVRSSKEASTAVLKGTTISSFPSPGTIKQGGLYRSVEDWLVVGSVAPRSRPRRVGSVRSCRQKAKGLQVATLDGKLGERIEACATKDILKGLPNASWPALKSLVGTKITFLSKSRGPTE